MRSPWLCEDDDHKQQLVSKPGVYDFFEDWSDDILDDLKQLSMAVDQVLGIAPPPAAEAPVMADNVGFIKQEPEVVPPVFEPKVAKDAEPKAEVKVEVKEEPIEVKPKKLSKEEVKKQERQKELDDLIKVGLGPYKTFDFPQKSIKTPSGDFKQVSEEF